MRSDRYTFARKTYSRPVNFALWILAEIAIAACDLAEVLGMAIGLQLLQELTSVLRKVVSDKAIEIDVALAWGHVRSAGQTP